MDINGLTRTQIEQICTVWPYTTWVEQDSDLTILGNKLNNARKKGFCDG